MAWWFSLELKSAVLRRILMCTQALVESHRLMLTFLSENSSLIITKDISLPQMDRHVTEDNILMSNFDPNNSFDSILEIFLYCCAGSSPLLQLSQWVHWTCLLDSISRLPCWTWRLFRMSQVVPVENSRNTFRRWNSAVTSVSLEQRSALKDEPLSN